MSDSENSATTSDEEHSYGEINNKHPTKRRKLDDSDVESPSDSSEEEYDDENEEEEEEEKEDNRPTRTRAARKRVEASGFILEEAEVDDDEEDEDIDDAESDFEEQEHEYSQEREEGLSAREIEGQRRRANPWNEDEAIKYLMQKYSGKKASGREVNEGDAPEELSELSLLPTSSDPNLWLVKCRLGLEIETVFLLTRKCLNSGKDFDTMSVVAPEGLKGFIYVEAHKEVHVRELIDGVRALSFAKQQIRMVKSEEMPQVLRDTKPTLQLKPKQWVRIKKGMFRDDLAEVVLFEPLNRAVHLKFLPRIDYTRKRGALKTSQTDDNSKKRKLFSKPPQKPFDPEAIRLIGGNVQVNGDFLVFEGNSFRDGFQYKIFSIDEVNSEGIQPSIAELDRFKRNVESVKVDKIIEQFEIGDNVEVVNNAMAGLLGKVTKKDEIMVTVQPSMEGFNEPMTFRMDELKKYFNVGDHVKVISGTFNGETGIVVRCEDNIVILISDINMTEVKVLSKDLKLSNDVAFSNDPSGRFMTGDLVHIDHQTVGIIVSIGKDSFNVLDMRGKVRTCKTSSLNKVRNQRDTIAMDSEGNSIQQKNVVKVVQGFNSGMEGRIAHIFRGFVFLHSHAHANNNGYFVSRPKNLLLPQIKKLDSSFPVIAGGDDFKMPMMSPRPAFGGNNFSRGEGRGGTRGGGRGGSRKRTDLIGKTVKIIQGAYKSYTGTVRDAVDSTARVLLYSDAKTISVDISRIKVIDGSSTSTGTVMPRGAVGNRTPAYGSQTPMYGSQTPMYGSQTPMYDGSRTPCVGSMTPHTEYGSMTPGRSSAWDPRGYETPSHNVSTDFDPFTPRDLTNLSDESSDEDNGNASGPVPNKGDLVDVVSGENKGKKGRLLNIDSGEGVVKVENGDILMIPLRKLRKQN